MKKLLPVILLSLLTPYTIVAQSKPEEQFTPPEPQARAAYPDLIIFTDGDSLRCEIKEADKRGFTVHYRDGLGQQQQAHYPVSRIREAEPDYYRNRRLSGTGALKEERAKAILSLPERPYSLPPYFFSLDIGYSHRCGQVIDRELSGQPGLRAGFTGVLSGYFRRNNPVNHLGFVASYHRHSYNMDQKYYPYNGRVGVNTLFIGPAYSAFSWGTSRRKGFFEAAPGYTIYLEKLRNTKYTLHSFGLYCGGGLMLKAGEKSAIRLKMSLSSFFFSEEGAGYLWDEYTLYRNLFFNVTIGLAVF